MTYWRIYSNDLPYGWREFGVDYGSLDEAVRIAKRWRRVWPARKYVVRKIDYHHSLNTISR